MVLYTFGNASGIDRESGLVVIKPSGIAYEDLTPDNLVVVDLHAKVVGGDLRTSSDTKTHCALYRAWENIGGIVHTHSTYATAWCQTQSDLPCYGTTHADYAAGPIPCPAPLSAHDVAGDYEEATGSQIINCFTDKKINPDHTPMVLVGGHAPFTWGNTPEKAHFMP